MRPTVNLIFHTTGTVAFLEASGRGIRERLGRTTCENIFRILCSLSMNRAGALRSALFKIPEYS